MKRWVKVGPKVLTLGRPISHKYSNPSKIVQTVFLFARVLLLVRISAILDHTRGVRAPKPPKNGYFVDEESVRKNYGIFNLAATSAILITLSTIMYLHESINRKTLRIRNLFFWLNLIVSLAKLLHKLDNIRGGIP